MCYSWGDPAILHLPLQIEHLHAEEVLKTAKEATMVRKLSLSTGSACAMNFPAAVLLCSCGQDPGTAVCK